MVYYGRNFLTGPGSSSRKLALKPGICSTKFNPSHSMNIILFVNACGFHLYQVLFVVFIAHQECKLTSGILSAKNLRSLFPMWIILYTSNYLLEPDK